MAYEFEIRMPEDTYRVVFTDDGEFVCSQDERMAKYVDFKFLETTGIHYYPSTEHRLLDFAHRSEDPITWITKPKKPKVENEPGVIY